MLSSEQERLKGDTSELVTSADTLDLVTEGIISYLDELDGYRLACLRHETTTAVYGTDRALHLVQIFSGAKKTLAYVRRAARTLSGWERSPFWDTDQARWMQLLRDTNKRKATGSTRNLIFNRGVAWAGRPVLICVSSPADGRFFRLELLLPPLWQEPGMLPLRTVALGILCHEYLLPESVARPLPPSTLPMARYLSPQRYLTRAMPQNLFASQCFSLGGAEQ